MTIEEVEDLIKEDIDREDKVLIILRRFESPGSRMIWVATVATGLQSDYHDLIYKSEYGMNGLCVPEYPASWTNVNF